MTVPGASQVTPASRSGPHYRDWLGAQLRQVRVARGLRLVDVASAAHVSTAYLSEVERGRKEPFSHTLEAICDALDVSVRVSLHMRNVPVSDAKECMVCVD